MATPLACPPPSPFPHHFGLILPRMSASAPVRPRPASDVSAGVGLAGLAGLGLWILVCRSWPSLVEVLGLPGPQPRLSGPYAACLGVVFSGLPMIVWSLAMDKVHLRPSTG